MAAAVPVPWSITSASMARICSAVVGDTTRREAPGAASWRSPSVSRVAATRAGGT
jgi:hypothetical protein